MIYTYKIEDGVHQIAATNEEVTVFFNADPNSDLPEHGQMISVFESNAESVADFAQMLLEDHDNAFTNFINKYISNQ